MDLLRFTKEPLDADLMTCDVKVKFKGKVREYIASEMPSVVRDEWMDNMRQAMKTETNEDEEKTTNMETFKDHQSVLICCCLRDKETGEAPKVEDVRQWGTRSCNQLFELCQYLNGMSDKAEEEEKKPLKERNSTGTE